MGNPLLLKHISKDQYNVLCPPYRHPVAILSKDPTGTLWWLSGFGLNRYGKHEEDGRWESLNAAITTITAWEAARPADPYVEAYNRLDTRFVCCDCRETFPASGMVWSPQMRAQGASGDWVCESCCPPLPKMIPGLSPIKPGNEPLGLRLLEEQATPLAPAVKRLDTVLLRHHSGLD